MCFQASTTQSCLVVRSLTFKEEFGKKLLKLANQGLNFQQFPFQNLGFYCLEENKLMGKGLVRLKNTT
jgi:hypothetical protein